MMRRRVARSKRSACPTRKVRYRDHESATRALRNVAGSCRGKIPVRAYRCNLCRGWLLTSQTERT